MVSSPLFSLLHTQTRIIFLSSPLLSSPSFEKICLHWLSTEFCIVIYLEIRARIVNELLSTEEYYISCLQKLTNVYVPTLREHGLSEKDIKSLFSNLETILKFNQELYKELKNAITSWTPTQTIGNIFITMVWDFTLNIH
jgi:hypothetical protein